MSGPLCQPRSSSHMMTLLEAAAASCLTRVQNKHTNLHTSKKSVNMFLCFHQVSVLCLDPLSANVEQHASSNMMTLLEASAPSCLTRCVQNKHTNLHTSKKA